MDKLGISARPLANLRSEEHHRSSRLGTGWSRTKVAVWAVVLAAAPVVNRAPRWAATPGQLLGWFGGAGLGIVRPRVEPAVRCSARAPVSAVGNVDPLLGVPPRAASRGTFQGYLRCARSQADHCARNLKRLARAARWSRPSLERPLG